MRLNLTPVREWARSPDWPLAQRVMWAGVGWSNNSGHAQFAAGQLQDLLGSPLPDGSWKFATRQSVTKAIRAAKDRGLIGADSNARCIVMPAQSWNQGGATTGGCMVHPGIE